ncbi:MAG: sigma-70 family RNA polymerase sigma factor [Pirellulaceae bacterium]
MSFDLHIGRRNQQISPQDDMSPTTRHEVSDAKSDNPCGEIDTSSLCHGVRNGDDRAFECYYDLFFDVMHQEARRLLGHDDHTCLDMVQDSMIKAMKCMPLVDSNEVLTRWSRVVVRTTVLDWLRKRARRREINSSKPEWSIEKAQVPEDKPNDAEIRMAWIETQLDEMPGELARLFSFRYRLGWTLTRIGKKFGMSPGAVDGRLRRAVVDLQKKAERLEQND